MWCANCGKTISNHEPRTWTVLPGGTVQVPTCYYDRFCYSRKSVMIPTAIIKNTVVESVVFIVSRGMAKYRRRIEFIRWWKYCKKQ